MDNVRILRLQCGEDIIAAIEQIDENAYELSEPMQFVLVQKGSDVNIQMQHWLPVQLIKENKVSIEGKDILFIEEPTDSFAEYYTNSVEKIKDLFEMKNQMDTSESYNSVIKEAFEFMENTENVLH